MKTKIVYGPTHDAWQGFIPFLSNLIDVHHIKKVCDVGGGANPALSSGYISENSLDYTLLDISENELNKAPENYNKILADIASPDFTPGNKFDLVFVDGPKEQLKGGMGRDAAIKIASQVSDNIIIHDAGRCEEELFQRKYLRSVFKLVRKSGNHITRCHYWVRRPKPVTLEDILKGNK